MNAIVQTLNTAGQAFVGFAVPMLIQSSLLILILLAVDAVLRKRVRAVFRYWIWMLVLVKLVLPPSLWSPVSVGTWVGETLEAPAAALLEPPEHVSRASSPRFEGGTPSTQQGQDARATRFSPAVDNFLSQPQPATAAPPLPEPMAPQAPAPAEAASQPAPVDRLPALSLNWQGFVLLVWAGVVAALLLLLAQRTFFVRGLVAQADEPSQALLDGLDRCRQHLGVRGPISVRLSPNATSPAVCGLWQPVILIPQNLAARLHGTELRAVLFHELAHIKRGDLWINLLQTLLQILYFYHPLLWLANAVIRRVREQAVDEMVLVALGESAPQYPDTLINVAKLALARRPALSLRLIGVVESKSALTSRIKHILNRPLPRTAKLGLVGVIAILTTAAVLLPMAKATDGPVSAVGIHETLNISDKSGHLTIRSVYMAPPNGKRISGRNEAILSVHVENSSPQETYLGLEYYADSGTVASFFSPGASSGVRVLPVPARWQGTLTCPIHYSRFVRGGYIQIRLAKCRDQQSQVLLTHTQAFLSPEVEVLHDKKYRIFSEEEPQTTEPIDDPSAANLNEEPQALRYMFPDLVIEASYPNPPGAFLREYRAARGALDSAQGTPTESQRAESRRTFEALSRQGDAFPISLYAQRWVIILDWLSGTVNAIEAARRMNALAEAQHDVAQSNSTKAYAATILARDGHLNRVHDIFVSCSPSETPQWGWFVFETDKYLNRHVEACAPNVNRIVDGRIVQTGRTPEQWQAIDTKLRAAQTAYADYLEYELLPLAATAITSQRARPYSVLERLQIADALRYLLVGHAHCFSLGATTHAIETRFHQQIAPKILAAWHQSLELFDRKQQAAEVEGYVREIQARWAKLNLPWDSLPTWWGRIRSDAQHAPARARTNWVESRTMPESWERSLTAEQTMMRDRMPLRKLVAHAYYDRNEPICISVPVHNGAGWKPSLDEIDHDPDDSPWIFLIDGQEYRSRIGFGPFDSTGVQLDLLDQLFRRPAEFHLPVGKHTVAYGWKDLDVIDPNDPGHPVHFARLVTDPVAFEVVEQLPADYYRLVYREGWEDTLRRSIETFFTDGMSQRVTDALLSLRVNSLPFDTAFAVYVQAQGSTQSYRAGELARTAGSPPFLVDCSSEAKELNWDTVGDRRWRIVLKPDVEVAKRSPPIREFYAREFVTEWLTFERSPQFEEHRQAWEQDQVRPVRDGAMRPADKSAPVELELSLGQHQYLDLDTGQFVAVAPQEARDPNSLRARGVDLYLTVEPILPNRPPLAQIQALQMAFATAPAGLDLQQIFIDNVRESLRLAGRPLEGTKRVTAYVAGGTYAFRTAEGAAGVFRVIWPRTDEPPRCTIQYRRIPELDTPSADFSWSAAAHGVQCRLRAPRQTWRADETVSLALDLRHQGEEALHFVPLAQTRCELEVDGAWYGWAEMLIVASPVWSLEPGTERDDAISVRLLDSWALPAEGTPLTFAPGKTPKWGPRLALTPGRHTIRVRFYAVENRLSPEALDLSTVSNPVEINVRAGNTEVPAAAPGSADQEKTITLRDEDPMLLDLATGELVRMPPAPPGSPTAEIHQAIKKMGKGDLLYDSDLGDHSLILMRDASSEQAQEPTGDLFKGHIIRHVPETLTVITAEGRQYRVTILAADDKACTLKYSQIVADRGAGGGALVEPGIAPHGVNIYLLADESIDLKAARAQPLSELVLRKEPWIAAADIERYDLSSHALYLKNNKPLPFPSVALRGNPFVVTAGGQRCYLGSLWTHISSFLPERTTPLIYVPSISPPDIVLIEQIVMLSSPGETAPDVRRDPRVVQALAANGQLHAGLEVRLDRVEVVPREGGSSLQYTYTLRNKDSDDLYVLDPGKMGVELFHFFNNPPFLLSMNDHRGFQADTSLLEGSTSKAPDQLDMAWLSLLKSGTSMTHTLTLPAYARIPPDQYTCSFHFNSPGRLATNDQREQTDGRIWVGQINASLSLDVGSSESATGSLELRIAPTAEEVGSELVEKYKQALTRGGRPPSDNFAWFEVRPDTVLVPEQITCEHDGKTYLLLWNDKSHVMLADGTWGVVDAYKTTDEIGNTHIVPILDDKGVQLFHALGNANLRHFLAVVFEGRVVAIPFINTTLSGPGLQIIGQFTAEEARQIVAGLKKVVAQPQPPRAAEPTAAPGAPVSRTYKDSFSVYGIVADQSGRPMAGVKVTAYCGIATLDLTGRTLTDEAGRYLLRFGSAFPSPRPEEVPFQAAIICARKAGFYEASLCRQGRLAMAGTMPSGEKRGLLAPYVGVVLPNQPYQLDFVMRPAARVIGELVDAQGRPLSWQTVVLNGDGPLYPGQNVLESVETEQSGAFLFDAVPLQAFWFEVHASFWSEDRGRMLARTRRSIDFTIPGTWRVKLMYNESAPDSARLRLAIVDLLPPAPDSPAAIAAAPGDKAGESAGPAEVLKRLLTEAPAGGVVTVPKGRYTTPVEITKPVTLCGESVEGCVIEVTADQPALLVNTQGKGQVILENLTIRWQLAGSEKMEFPAALLVKGTDVVLRNCRFTPLGDFRRSPMAVYIDRPSKSTVEDCRFSGFDYVVCYGPGTEGVVQDCVIRDCGHQGIINYDGATLTVQRNIITGSRFHAVRCTGGTLHVQDNLLIQNANRGIYLGNKSGRGFIINNLILGNGTGISGFAQATYGITNNVIADNSFSGIDMRDSCMLDIHNNVFVKNQRALMVYKEGTRNYNTANENTYWHNVTDIQNFDRTPEPLQADPQFVDPNHGDFSVRGPAQQRGHGLVNPQIIQELWKRYEQLPRELSTRADAVSQSSQAPVSNQPPTALAWQRTDQYVPPDPDGFFPDDPDGGKRLDVLFQAVDKDRRFDEEILSTVRQGFRRTTQDHSSILAWVGRRYIWGKDPQSPLAVEIMYHAVPIQPGAAVYYGLSVLRRKPPNVLRTLAEICLQGNGEDIGRILWGLGPQREELVPYLSPYLQDQDTGRRELADALVRSCKGQLDFEQWQRQKRREQAPSPSAEQVQQIRQALLTGDSQARFQALIRLMRSETPLWDDSLLPAMQAAGTDPDRRVRDNVARLAGNHWVWAAKEQDPNAVELMLRLAADSDRGVRYQAVYYGLSVVRDKREPVVRRLVELALTDHDNSLYGRIVWGLRGFSKDTPSIVEKILTEHLVRAKTDIQHAASVCGLYQDVLGKEPPADWGLAHIRQHYPEDLFVLPFSAREPFQPESLDALWSEFARALPEGIAADRLPLWDTNAKHICYARIRGQEQAATVRDAIANHPRLRAGDVRPLPLATQLYLEERYGTSAATPQRDHP